MLLRKLKNVLNVFFIVLATLSIVYVAIVIFLSFFAHNYVETNIEDYYDDDEDDC